MSDTVPVVPPKAPVYSVIYPEQYLYTVAYGELRELLGDLLDSAKAATGWVTCDAKPDIKNIYDNLESLEFTRKSVSEQLKKIDLRVRTMKSADIGGGVPNTRSRTDSPSE